MLGLFEDPKEEELYEQQLSQSILSFQDDPVALSRTEKTSSQELMRTVKRKRKTRLEAVVEMPVQC